MTTLCTTYNALYEAGERRVCRVLGKVIEDWNRKRFSNKRGSIKGYDHSRHKWDSRLRGKRPDGTSKRYPYKPEHKPIMRMR